MIGDSPIVEFTDVDRYDIPWLRQDAYEEFHGGVKWTPWGSVSRGTQCDAVHFYVDDYRFRAIVDAPTSLLKTQCQFAVEPNVSVFDDTPEAYAIWATYKKRRAARAWQDSGVTVLVDLCVPEKFAGVNLIGVPPGYRLFATRAFSRRPQDVLRELEVAMRVSGGSGILVAVGGGMAIRELCESTPGLSYVDQFIEQRKIRKQQGVQHVQEQSVR